MPGEQIYATFPGVRAIKSVTFTMTPGISPSVGTIECLPQQEKISEDGDLTIYGGETIVIRNCRIGRGAMVYSGSQVMLSLQVLDRRWKWSYGEISGEYNLRDRKNLVIGDTAQDAYALMNKCLRAMGEKDENFDTSAVPPGIHPHVEWVNANPAKSLAALCDLLGFIVTLKLDGRVVIEKLGTGEELSNDQAISISPVVDPPEGPDKIKVIGAPTRYQALLHLEAVGQDLDGKVKPIDELSYAPPPDENGVRWRSTAPELQIPGFGREQEEKKRAAKATVYRWYRAKISGVADDAYGLQLPLPNGALKTVYSLNEILPLSGDLVETYTEFGRERRKRARIYGTFYVGSHRARNSNQRRGPQVNFATFDPEWVTVEGSPINFPYQAKLATFPGVPSDFSIIEEFGIVEFPQTVTRAVDINGKKYFQAADLWLMCSFNWRDATYPTATAIDSNAYQRYEYTKEMPGRKFGTGPEVINKESELQDQQYANYTPGGTLPIASWRRLRGLDELDKAAKHYADGAAQKYVTVNALDITYAGLKSIDVDGAVRQVTWSVDGSGPTTRVGFNTEPHPYVREYRFARFLEKMATLARDPRALIPDLPHAYIPVV